MRLTYVLLGCAVLHPGCSSDEAPPPSTSNVAGAGTGASGGAGGSGGSSGKGSGGTSGKGGGTGGATGGTGGDTGGTGGATGGSGGDTGGIGGEAGGSGGDPGGATGGSGGTSGSGGSAGGGTAGMPNTGDAYKIVVLGSSSAAAKNLDQPTYGGDPSYKGWVALYTDYLATLDPPSTLVTLALAGQSTYNALPTGTPDTANRPPVETARNITAALAEGPDAIIVSYPSGGNLETGGYTVDEIIDNLHTIVDTATAAGVPVWVATSQPLNETTTTPTTIALSVDLSNRVENDFGTKALDFWTPLANSDGTAKDQYQLTDGQHPNQAGHQQLFDVVIAADIPGNL